MSLVGVGIKSLGAPLEAFTGACLGDAKEVGEAVHPVKGLQKWSPLNAGPWATVAPLKVERTGLSVDVAPLALEVWEERSVSLGAEEALSSEVGH